jgi:drug/metabolite transporter (DMT)-like permease
MSTAARSPDAATLALFGVAVLLGAGNFLAVRLSNLGLPPFFGAGLRFALAAAIFAALCLLWRLPWPRGRDLRTVLLFCVTGIAGFYALMYWSLLVVAAGVATVVTALVPLATLLLAAAQGLERVTLRSLAGGVIAVTGIAAMALEGGDLVLPLGRLLAMLAAVACVSQSFVFGKRLAHLHPATINALGLGTGAMLLLALSTVTGEAWTLPQRAEAAWALVYLVTLGSVGLFFAALVVVKRWTASATSYMFVLFPVATMALERVLLGEPLRAGAVAGAALVMAGVWIGALARGRRRAPAPA